MKQNTLSKIRKTLTPCAKFQTGDKVLFAARVVKNLSGPVIAHNNQTAEVLGYRNYYGVGEPNYGGNRYYVRFADGYIAGIFPCFMSKVAA